MNTKLAWVSSRLLRQLTAETIVANITQKIILGIDVAKSELVIFNWINQQRTKLANDAKAIRSWLRSFHGPLCIAVEPTSHYHREVVDQAAALGHQVYLVNPRQLVHYREGISRRNKTDAEDAYLLARFVAREADELRAYQPLCAQSQKLWALLKRRAVIVAARKRLRQSLADVQVSAKALFTQFDRLLKRIDQRIKALLKDLGWGADIKRCLSIPGIGPLNAAALVATYHRGAFASSDAFIAFIGFDVRLRESGTYKGKAKLSKCGEAEIRRLLYCATKPARSHAAFDQYRQRQLAKGRSKIVSNVALARKLARIAFALIENGTSFNKTPNRTGYAP
ncbi:MAG: transposase [Gammaproteobacteria bacterium]|nr:transposase [Gammaproteobacteria bacterium]